MLSFRTSPLSLHSVTLVGQLKDPRAPTWLQFLVTSVTMKAAEQEDICYLTNVSFKHPKATFVFVSTHKWWGCVVIWSAWGVIMKQSRNLSVKDAHWLCFFHSRNCRVIITYSHGKRLLDHPPSHQKQWLCNHNNVCVYRVTSRQHGVTTRCFGHTMPWLLMEEVKWFGYYQENHMCL